MPASIRSRNVASRFIYLERWREQSTQRQFHAETAEGRDLKIAIKKSLLLCELCVKSSRRSPPPPFLISGISRAHTNSGTISWFLIICFDANGSM